MWLWPASAPSLLILPGRKKTAAEKKKHGTEDEFITVKHGKKSVKLPRLKQVIPETKIKKENSLLKNKKESGTGEDNNELDIKSVKRLLLEILKTQKQILEVLKKEFGGK